MCCRMLFRLNHLQKSRIKQYVAYSIKFLLALMVLWVMKFAVYLQFDPFPQWKIESNHVSAKRRNEPGEGTMMVKRYLPQDNVLSSNGNKSTINIWKTFDARRLLTQMVCTSSQRKDVSKRVHGVFYDNKAKLAYCIVPKTGCTFWKRVFAFLNQDTLLEHAVASPFDIPRTYIHKYRYRKGFPWVEAKIRDHLRFTFTRDPYNRLWSSYLDKLYLPDFWMVYGKMIMRKRLPPPTDREIKCGVNVTFLEFINFSFIVPEPHWTPITDYCDPCLFKPHVIGKMETFAEDARALLSSSNLSWILNNVDDLKHARNEVDMLTNYNFEIFRLTTGKSFVNECISLSALGDRLWRVFQHNGYISNQYKYAPPVPFSVNALKTIALSAVTKTFKEVSKEQLTHQKKTALLNAYKMLPIDTMKRIAQKYHRDIITFDYSSKTIMPFL